MNRIKRIESYPDYYITNDGRVLTSAKKQNCKIWKRKWLNSRSQNSGYRVVDISNNGIKKTLTVHRLVALAFVDGYSFENNEVNHIDGNKNNNNSSNLEWVSRSENAKHMHKNGLWKISEQGIRNCINTGKRKPSEEEKLKMAASSMKLTVDECVQIRIDFREAGISIVKFAKLKGVSDTVIKNCIYNRYKAFNLEHEEIKRKHNVGTFN